MCVEEIKRNAIYDRLLAIRVKLESGIPDPRYINKKIGECHACIEEVEHFSIEVSREISVLEQALNNSTAEYDSKKEELILKEGTKELPSIKDREAKANQQLREELGRIKEYKSQLTALVRLEKDLHAKMRNLDRVNKDIKTQQRVMEAQMKLLGNAPSGAVDLASKSLIDEFKKSISNTDSFEDSLASVSKEQTVDATVSLDVESLMEPISEKTLDPTPDIAPEEIVESSEKTEEVDPVESAQEEMVEDSAVEEDIESQVDIRTIVEDKPEIAIDLNEVIDFTRKEEGGGNAPTQKVIEPKIEKPVELTQKIVHQDQKIGIDIDDLLDSLQS